MILAQVSDPHIVPPGQLLGGEIDTAAYLQRCVARLESLAPRPDAVLITGDLVDRGDEPSYRALRDLLAPLAMPVYLALGNHDERAAFLTVLGDAEYLERGDFVQYGFDLGELRVLVLDTNVPGEAGGRLCATRLSWLTEQLARAGGRPVVIAMHHPPFVTGIPFMDACGLDRDDTAALAAIVARHPSVERVICGHLHRPIQTRFAGTLASTVPSCAHQVALTFDPAAPVSITLEPPAFALHVWNRAALVTHQVYV